MVISIIIVVAVVCTGSGYFLANLQSKKQDVLFLGLLEDWKNTGKRPEKLLNQDQNEVIGKIEELITLFDHNIKNTPETDNEKEKLEELQLQLNNMLVVNELGERLTSSLQLSATFDHLYKTLNSIMDASVVELSVFNSDDESWNIYSNIKSEIDENYQNHIAEWACVNKRAVFLDNVEKNFGRYVNKPLILSDGRTVNSIVTYPIEHNEMVIGSISVMSFRTEAYTSYHTDSIQHLLSFIAVSIQNADTHNKLDKLRIRAEESEKHEQQFLANMSHEIRTPMNAVLGMTNLLLDSNPNERQLKYLSAINTSSKNLLVIINDILDLSKLEAGKMEIETIPFKMHEVIDNIYETNRFKAEEKGLKFSVNIEDALPNVVKGDPTRLNQILTNLCSNAIKFTEKGFISIDVTKPKDSNFIRFSVKDSGIGIPEDKLHLLFSNFKQVDSSTYRKYGGTGLGLSISKTLIELQGGTVEVKSKHGSGSEFTVSIPFMQASSEEINHITESKKHDYSGLDSIKILVAEDNVYNQIVVNDTLEVLINNVTIDIAENGLIALDKLNTGDYDIILMDAQMPEMDGLEATKRIRNLDDAKKKNIPVIALTASVHKSDIDKCFLAGMNGFVPKPFTRDELLGTLTEFYHNPNGNSFEVNKKEQPQKEANAEQPITASNENVTDMTFLREFSEGDEKRMTKYIGLYLKLLPANLEKIQAAISIRSNEDLVKVIHGMRPHLNYMGMKNSGELAAEIEVLVHNGKDLDKTYNMAERIINECKKSQKELDITLKSLNK
ncbi:MAG: response regulator [Bacteroidia bacterium]